MAHPIFAASLAIALAGCAASLPAPKEERMSLDGHKTIANALVSDVFNEHRYERLEAYVDPDFHSHNPQVPRGVRGLETFARKLVDGFADLRGEVLHTIAEGDKVMIWVRWRGSHTGTFAGVPATGNTVEFDTVEIFRVEGGKVVEHWDVADRTTLMAALRPR